MAKVLDVIELGHPTLRKQAKAVNTNSLEDHAQLIDNMFETLNKYRGVGLAAPQVNIPKRLFIVAGMNTGDKRDEIPRVVINPKITSTGQHTESDWEGCLSIPGIRGLVPRPKHIDVEYTALNGDTITERLSGFVARVFLHEYDHLDGIVYLDRLNSNRDIITDKAYAALMEEDT